MLQVIKLIIYTHLSTAKGLFDIQNVYITKRNGQRRQYKEQMIKYTYTGDVTYS